MGVVDFKSNLGGRPGRAKDPEIEASKQRAQQRKQAQLDAQKRVDAKRMLEQQSAKLREINLINKTQDTRTFQAATQALRKSKVPSREIGFFKPTAPLAKRPTTTPLDAFVPDAIPNNVFLDSSGAFNPIDTNVQKYVQTRNDNLRQNSPIEVRHDNPPPRIGNFPLASYYSQLKGSGPLGIKGPPNGTGPLNLGFKQPFVVRDIGNNWGVDKFTGSLKDIKGVNIGSALSVLRIGFNALDELGGAVLGRQPSVYMDRAGADLFRMGMFLASVKGLGFLEKQRVLKRTNPQGNLGSVRGPISGIYPTTLNSNKAFSKINRDNALREGYDGGTFGSESGNLAKTAINLQKYSPLSLASQPGVRSLQLSINDPFDPTLGVLTQAALRGVDKYNLSIEQQGGSVPLEVLKKFPSNWSINGININSPDIQRRYNITVDSKLDFPTDKLLSLVAPVADAVSRVAGQGLKFLRNLRGPKISIGLPNVGKAFSFPKVKNPFSGKSPNSFDLSGVQGLVQNAGQVLKGIRDNLSVLDINIDKVPVDSSKKSASEQNLEAFAEVGIDRVNLIPYGTREEAQYNGQTEDQLDFVPFRFVDYNGKHIVFRAILSGISDSFTPDYAEEKYVGRPDKVYVYTGTTRTISFTFDVYPKSAEELPVLWEKMNYLAGLTYPDMKGGKMVAPFSKLTIGEMYTEMPGYISALTYTVQDNGTWETMWTKSPKYIQANVTYIPIMDRLPANDQALYDYPWLQKKFDYDKEKGLLNTLRDAATGKYKTEDVVGAITKANNLDDNTLAEAQKKAKGFLDMVGNV